MDFKGINSGIDARDAWNMVSKMNMVSKLEIKLSHIFHDHNDSLHCI